MFKSASFFSIKRGLANFAKHPLPNSLEIDENEVGSADREVRKIRKSVTEYESQR